MHAARGSRHVTQFATWLDGWYVEHFGEPPVDEYGAGLCRWGLVGDVAVDVE